MNNELSQDYTLGQKISIFVNSLAALLFIPIYIIGVLFEMEKAHSSAILTVVSPIIGFISLFIQFLILGFTGKFYRQKMPQSKIHLLLSGGTFLNIFFFFGGCTLMAPIRF